MLLRCHEATLDRVIVDIVDLLLHHLITVDFLRVRAFLPDLMAAFGFVFAAKIIEFGLESFVGSNCSVRALMFILPLFAPHLAGASTSLHNLLSFVMSSFTEPCNV